MKVLVIKIFKKYSSSILSVKGKSGLTIITKFAKLEDFVFTKYMLKHITKSNL